MSSDNRSLETFYLNLFRFVVLVVMTISVAGTAGALLYSIYQYAQSPKEPAPAQTAPAKSINTDEFIKQLRPKPAPLNKQDENSENERPVPSKNTELKYLEESKQVFSCARNSNIKAGREVPNEKFIDNLRDYLNDNAARNDRGDAWVANTAAFTCKILLNEEVIALKKKYPELQVTGPALQFHLSKWDKNQQEILEFENNEKKRIDSEKRDEEIRVILANAKGFTALLIAGTAFAIFMALALYLLISAIETNLRNINSSIQNLQIKNDEHKQNSNQTLIEDKNSESN